MDVIGNKNSKTLFIYPDGGLGNRLISIYWGLYWQSRLKCKMKILWEIDMACGIRFEKLFAPLSNVNVKTIYTMPVSYEITLQSAIGKWHKKLRKKRLNYFSAREIIHQLYTDDTEMALERLADYSKEQMIRPYENLVDWKYISKVAGSIKPVAEIADRVNNIMGAYKESSVIGIHIRRTDHKQAIQKSPLSVFVDQMDKIMEDAPDTYFYLATDDTEVESQLAERFPLIKHIYFSSEKSRRTEAGMMDAYVDMLCLSRCDKIYGSYLSTFSKMASVIGGKECIVLQEE